MAKPSAGQSLLEDAYDLNTPDDNRAYYDPLAQSYDTQFVEALGYSYPKTVAAIYRREATAQDVPVIDMGCGTGIVAEGLRLPAELVDGVDISPEMLRLAEAKELYGRLFAADLTQSLDALPHGYGGVISAGTFTHGHLGPEVLRSLLGLARHGGLFVIGINEKHFAAHGFGATFEALEAEGAIGGVRTERRAMYDKAGHDHSNDHALVVIYRRT